MFLVHFRQLDHNEITCLDPDAISGLSNMVYLYVPLPVPIKSRKEIYNIFIFTFTVFDHSAIILTSLMSVVLSFIGSVLLGSINHFVFDQIYTWIRMKYFDRAFNLKQ